MAFCCLAMYRIADRTLFFVTVQACCLPCMLQTKPLHTAASACLPCAPPVLTNPFSPICSSGWLHAGGAPLPPHHYRLQPSAPCRSRSSFPPCALFILCNLLLLCPQAGRPFHRTTTAPQAFLVFPSKASQL